MIGRFPGAGIGERVAASDLGLELASCTTLGMGMRVSGRMRTRC